MFEDRFPISSIDTGSEIFSAAPQRSQKISSSWFNGRMRT